MREWLWLVKSNQCWLLVGNRKKTVGSNVLLTLPSTPTIWVIGALFFLGVQSAGFWTSCIGYKTQVKYTKHCSILVPLALCLKISTAALCIWPHWPMIRPCQQSLELHTVYTGPLITHIPHGHWFGIDLLIGHGHWEQFIILFYVLNFISTVSKTKAGILWLLRLLCGQLKAISKTCIIGSDTSLTISSLFTHAHYFCLVEQWSSFSSAGGDTAHDLPLRHHILTSRELIWQHITTATQLTNNLAEI